MTKPEFDRTSWSKGMLIKYEGLLYPVAGVSFANYEIMVYESGGINWIECEPCEIVNKDTK